MKQDSTMQVCGIDIGDRFCRVFVMKNDGTREDAWRMPTTRKGLSKAFAGKERMRIALEVGTHSGWICRDLEAMGHEVVVANPRRLEAIWKNWKKSDDQDAECLARLVRVDPQLLKPVKHRSESEARHMAMVRSRAVLVATRTSLINHVRSMLKTMGLRAPKCSSSAFVKRVNATLGEADLEALKGVLSCLAETDARVREYDRKLEELAKAHSPETTSLQTVPGVGPITALVFRLVVQSPERFPDSRSVAAYLGLVPRRDQSGERDPQLGISKAGDDYLRTLLVQAGHYLIGPFGQDCRLRRWGLALAGRGGKNAKKRAVVAVARKLSVVLLAMWRSGQDFDAWHQLVPEEVKAA